ncbi:MAG: 50S ribosomal protein L18e [Thaumarchaeota archaeon]|nr:50S ribosomal protein L18e [Nitrososphaerota archaeon]MBI3022547.1 50S ribosomal protein L18e [Nitrososphaerota archaeon]MBI3116032.1 50S ribosomal protein L18e [Nitrososphaerota archaeon]MCS4540112.1 50S ribosomal protein L18e [Nitrososphaerota archaeon]
MKAVNSVLKGTIVRLERQGRKRKAPVWASASEILSRGSSTRVEVNVNHLTRFTGKKQPIFVPGKVLGTGVVEKGLVVGAYAFSSSARKKIEAAGGEAVGVEEFLKRYPEGSGVIIVS